MGSLLRRSKSSCRDLICLSLIHILHYLNNNLIPIISGTFSADVLENQTVSWKDLPVALVLNGLDVYKRQALFFALNPDKAIIADSNPELINMYRQVADNVEVVISYLKKYKNRKKVN